MTDETRRTRLAVVVNPTRAEAAEELLEQLDDDVDVELIRPNDADELAECIRRAGERADIVAAVGGDGTQATAADVLAGTGVTLAVVPGGTVNLLARILDVGTVEAAAAAISAGHDDEIDVGDADGSTFVLNASSGLDAATMQRVDDGAKRLGRLGYVLAGLRALASRRPERVAVAIDGEEWFAGRAMTVVVTNFGQRGSAEFTIAPGSSPDDGRLDVVVQRCDSLPAMVRTIWALARRRQPREDDLVVGHGCHIDVEWARPVLTQRDGDVVGRSATIRHRVRPGRLSIRRPAEVVSVH